MEYTVLAILCSINVISFGLLVDIFNKVDGVLDNIFDGNKVLSDIDEESCMNDVSTDYQKAQSYFIMNLFDKVSDRSDNNFVFSPNSIWLSLSALAEGADPSVKSDFLGSLYLPKQKCTRYKFYNIALHMEELGTDVNLLTQRKLILDQHLEVNPNWIQFIKKFSFVYIAFAPIRSKPFETSIWLKKLMNTQKYIPLKGNSIILSTVNYQGLWTTAFDSAIYQAPFNNDLGEQIGRVDMMNTRKRVRFTQSFMNIKVVELPVGVDGRYTMFIAVGTDGNVIKNVIDIFSLLILENFSALNMTLVSVDISVPRFQMSTEFDVRAVLEESGIYRVWQDPAATSYISHPAAKPGSLIQRVTIKFDSRGIEPASSTPDNLESYKINNKSSSNNTFIANRPFLFALINTKTHTCVFLGVFSKPYIDI